MVRPQLLLLLFSHAVVQLFMLTKVLSKYYCEINRHGALFACFVIINTVFVHKQHPLIQIKWAKGIREEKPLYESGTLFPALRL